MPRLSLSLLGSFQATLDGRPITGFESDRVRGLLAYLAVEAGRPHRRDKLVGLLWPDWPESSALTNLRNALANLRKAIGDREAASPILLVDRETIQFNPAGDAWVDVHAFQTLTAPQQPPNAFRRRRALSRAVPGRLQPEGQRGVRGVAHGHAGAVGAPLPGGAGAAGGAARGGRRPGEGVRGRLARGGSGAVAGGESSPLDAPVGTQRPTQRGADAVRDLPQRAQTRARSRAGRRNDAAVRADSGWRGREQRSGGAGEQGSGQRALSSAPLPLAPLLPCTICPLS